MGNVIVLTNFEEFFNGIGIVRSFKTSFVRQWNPQSFENSSHLIIHMKSIWRPNALKI